MKPRHLLMLVGLLLTGGLLVFGDHDAGSDLAQPLARGESGAGQSSPTPTPTPTLPAKPGSGLNKAAAMNPAEAASSPLFAILDRAATVDATRAGRRSGQLFSTHSWVPAVVQAVAVLPAAPVVPRAPPLPFSYLGRQSRGGLVEVFLAQGDRTHVAREGSLIDGVYRIDTISPAGVNFTYLPLNQIQQLAIRGTD